MNGTSNGAKTTQTFQRVILGRLWEQGGSKSALAEGFEPEQETLGEKYK